MFSEGIYEVFTGEGKKWHTSSPHRHASVANVHKGVCVNFFLFNKTLGVYYSSPFQTGPLTNLRID